MAAAFISKMLFGSVQPGCTGTVVAVPLSASRKSWSDNSAVSTRAEAGQTSWLRDQAVLLGSQHHPCELQEFIFPFGAPELEFQNENHILSSLFRQKISSSILLKLSQCCKGVKISQVLAHALNLVVCVCQFGFFCGPCAGCGWAREVPRSCHALLSVAALAAYNSFSSFRVRCLSSKWVNHRCNFLHNYQL